MKGYGNKDGYKLVFASPWFSFSMPGSDIAIFLNKLLTLWPALADVSMNMIPICVAFAVASSNVTCLLNLSQKTAFQQRRRGNLIPLVR